MTKKIILLLSLVLILSSCDIETKNNETDPNKSDQYIEYTEAIYKEKLGKEKFMVFFHADWCPLCRQLESKIKEDLSILNGHSILEANYDREIELKKEFDVLTQTTVIFINQEGTVVEKKVNPSIEFIKEFFSQ